jgi:hypothetical protein
MDLIANLLYGLFNVAIVIPTAWSIYHKDKESNVNRGISLALLLAVAGFIIYNVRSIFWNVPIFGIPLIMILIRFEYFTMIGASSLICWCALILRDGEALWDRTKSIVFFCLALPLNIFVIFLPDTFYLLTTSTEIHTGISPILYVIFHPSMVILQIVSFSVFISTYFVTKDDDPLTNRQVFRLVIGSSLLIIGEITNLVVSVSHFAIINTYIVPIFITLAMITVASGFSQESSLIQVKIMNTLKRLSRSLGKGNTTEAQKHLAYLTALIEEEKADGAIVRIRILEALMTVYQTNRSNAILSLESAKMFAEQHGFKERVIEIEKSLESLRKREDAGHGLDSFEAMQESFYKEDDLGRALSYLDEIIRYRSNTD